MLKLQGHSPDAEVYITKQGGDYVVIKRGNPRLLLQIEKQMGFKCSPRIKTAQIRALHTDDKNTTVEMEYLPYNECFSFASSSTKDGLLSLNDAIVELIEREIGESKLIPLDVASVLSKTEEVFCNIDKNECVQRVLANNASYAETLKKCHECLVDRLVPEKCTTLIPIGKCHGDLTMSNILINSLGQFHAKEIYVIDFLNTFMESPLQDVVKWRQDTRYAWTSTMMKNVDDLDLTKMAIALKYLDQLIVQRFSKFEWYSAYYAPFQILNLLRVVQHAKKEKIIIFLLEALCRDLNNGQLM